MRQRMVEAAEGSSELRNSFTLLGVGQLTASNGALRNTADVLEDLAAGLARLKSEGRGAEALKLSDDLFGGSQQALTAILSKGPQALQIWSEMAREMGVVNASQVRMASLVSQSFSELDRSWRSFKLQFLEQFGDEIIATVRTIAKFLRENSRFVIDLARDAITTVFNIMVSVGKAIVNVVRAILSAVDTIVEKVDKAGQIARATLYDIITFNPTGFRPKGHPFSKEEIEKRNAQDPARQKVDSASRSVDQASQSITQLEKSFAFFGNTYFALIDRAAYSWQKFREEAVESLNSVGQSSETVAAQSKKSWSAFFAGFGAGFEQWRGQLDDMTRAGAEAGQQIFSAVRNSLSQFFQDAIKGTKSVKEAFKDLMLSILDSIVKSFSDRIADQLLDGVFDTIFGALGTGGSGGAGSRVGPTLGSGRKRVVLGEGDPRNFGSLAGGFRSGGGDRAEIHFHVQALDARSVAGWLTENQKAIGDTVLEQMSRRSVFREVLRRG
ncbi:MAG: hypothetical protein AB7T19_14900 [Planctomycetota bacterium]